MKTLVICIDGANQEDITAVPTKPLDCLMDGMTHTSSSCYAIMTGEEATKDKINEFREEGYGQKKYLWDYIPGRKLIQNLPLTYPALPIDGVFVSGKLTAGRPDWIYPPALKDVYDPVVANFDGFLDDRVDPQVEYFTEFTDQQKRILIREGGNVDFAFAWFMVVDRAYHWFQPYSQHKTEFNEITAHLNLSLKKILESLTYDHVLIFSDHGHLGDEDDHNRYGFVYSPDREVTHIKDVFSTILELQGVR